MRKDREKSSVKTSTGNYLFSNKKMSKSSSTPNMSPRTSPRATALEQVTRLSTVTVVGYENDCKKLIMYLTMSSKIPVKTFFVDDVLVGINDVPHVMESSFHAKFLLSHPGLVIFPYKHKENSSSSNDGKTQLQYLRSYREFAKLPYLIVDISKKEKATNSVIKKDENQVSGVHMIFDKSLTKRARFNLLVFLFALNLLLLIYSFRFALSFFHTHFLSFIPSFLSQTNHY